MVEQVFRDEWGRVFAALIGFLGDFDLAEEAAQEAFAAAAERWPREGTPANPRAWLVTTARNRAIDRIRRDRTLVAKTRLLDVPEATEDDVDDETTIPDERLELLFTCCHPALALDAQVALTLRTLGGLSTEEIARAFVEGARALRPLVEAALLALGQLRDAGSIEVRRRRRAHPGIFSRSPQAITLLSQIDDADQTTLVLEERGMPWTSSPRVECR